ncbi:MAG: hypothetical protein AAB323_01595 [Pseudomonadota bacterium]|mgnify:CR=1 FL=1
MHKTSIGVDVVGFCGNLTYKRGPTFPLDLSGLQTKIVKFDDLDDAISDDHIEVSVDAVVKAGVIAERSGGKPLKLTVLVGDKVQPDMVRKKIDELIGDGANYRQQVFEKLPNQNNTAFMGGGGLSAGYHYQLPFVICNVRAGVDYLWGKFKQFDLYPSSLAQMGWGIKVGSGIDYRLTDKATFGFEAGMRFSAFRNPKIGSLNGGVSWFALPYLQTVCGFSPHADYGISAFAGYFFPTKFSVNSGGGIPSGTMCKVSGMFGGLRFVRYF